VPGVRQPVRRRRNAFGLRMKLCAGNPGEVTVTVAS